MDDVTERSTFDLCTFKRTEKNPFFISLSLSCCNLSPWATRLTHKHSKQCCHNVVNAPWRTFALPFSHLSLAFSLFLILCFLRFLFGYFLSSICEYKVRCLSTKRRFSVQFCLWRIHNPKFNASLCRAFDLKHSQICIFPTLSANKTELTNSEVFIATLLGREKKNSKFCLNGN